VVAVGTAAVAVVDTAAAVAAADTAVAATAIKLLSSRKEILEPSQSRSREILGSGSLIFAQSLWLGSFTQLWPSRFGQLAATSRFSMPRDCLGSEPNFCTMIDSHRRAWGSARNLPAL
jgi:hypothetical protein